MWPFKKKKEVLSLPASEARLVAQLEAVRVKFEREQGCLMTILYAAKRGEFEKRAADKNIYAVHLNNGHFAFPWIVTTEDVVFLKSLGYKIETNEVPVNQKFYGPNSSSYTTVYETRTMYYTEYLIKW